MCTIVMRIGLCRLEIFKQNERKNPKNRESEGLLDLNPRVSKKVNSTYNAYNIVFTGIPQVSWINRHCFWKTRLQCAEIIRKGLCAELSVVFCGTCLPFKASYGCVFKYYDGWNAMYLNSGFSDFNEQT